VAFALSPVQASLLQRRHRAYVPQTGRVVLTGAAADIARNADVQRAYLGL
jgi:branched-chain amino acid transport system ATP-binding protein